MKPRARAQGLWRRLHLAPVLVGLFWLALPSVASAHAFLISSSPGAGARLGTAPGVVVLRYSEAVQPGLSEASVTDPTGHRFTGTLSATSITIPLATNAPGTYRVDWKVVSADDGHTTHGTFEFSVVSAGAAAGGQAGPGATGFLASGFRAIQYAALLAGIGMLLLSSLARREPPVSWVHPRLRVVLAVLLAAGAATAATDTLTASSLSGAGHYLVATGPGVARLSAVVLEALALVAALAGAPVWPALGAAAVAIAASGHPADVHPAWWGISVDAAHLVAAGLWAGAIMALATIRAPGGWRGEEGRRLLDRFSPVALAAFGTTVALGVVQALVFLPSLGAFLHSDYGRVLGVKILAVGAMVPLSVLAWRRRIVTRAEAGVAAVVVLAAALLSAYPLPAPPAARAEAVARRLPADPGLPRPGDLTLAARAGTVLVALTVRPGRPGRNDLLIYVEPLSGQRAAARLPVHVSIDGRSIRVHECSDWCRSGSVMLSDRARVSVRVKGRMGGTARFEVPRLPAPPGAALFRRLQQRMDSLRTYRVREVFDTGLSTIRSTYEFQAPDRLRVSEPSGFKLVWIGRTRYQQQAKGSGWLVQPGGTRYSVPSFIWGYVPDRRFDFRVVGHAEVDGRRTRILSFYGPESSASYWFRLWVDPRGLVRRAEMRAGGHFMDQTFDRFDAPMQVKAPIEP